MGGGEDSVLVLTKVTGSTETFSISEYEQRLFVCFCFLGDVLFLFYDSCIF